MSHHEVGDRLPLFQSPLLSRDTSYQGADEDEKKPQREVADSLGSNPGFSDNDQALHDHPMFHRHTEATNAELFYDLFFVANLSVFTNVHEVNDHETLSQYIGFFSILWFTWYQVGLYDVRFSMDSVFERIAKACQFGVMIGFAVVGPRFNVGSKTTNDGEGPSLSSFKALTLILMASRFVIVLQYLQSLWFTKNWKQTRLPMLVIAGTYFVAGFIYLGLFFTFQDNESGENHTYLVWYVLAFLETMIATGVSSYWRVISFKGTHLVERMSLLTLIILGEGVMGLAERCQKIVKSDMLVFDSTTIGNIVAAVLILYFIYMLYFDW
jgi:low temperature requirement protein LtrA